MTKSTIKLGEHSFVTKLAGFEHSKYLQYNATHEVNEIPLIQGKNIKDGKVIYSFDWYITKEISNALPRSVLNKRCIVIPYVGSKLGELAIFENDFKCHLGSNVAKVELTDNVVELEYLYYYLKSSYGQSQLFKDKQGSAQPNITMEAIRETIVILFDKISQQKIASVLSSLDSKIELNNRINAELEAMAKTLYDYWFVQFDFPDNKGKPYRISGGKMVWNEELKRKIPEGWECYELSKIINRISTGLNPRKNFVLGNGSNYYVTIKNVDDWKIYLDDTCDKVDDKALDKINKRSDLRIGDILFTSIEPVGLTYLIQNKPENWNINESVFSLRPNYKLVTSEFAFLLLSGKEIKVFTKNVSAGSIHKGIRIGLLNTFKIPYGSKTIVEEFSKIIQPILKRIDLLNKENQKLSEIRDWLLPMLMNGQVKVKEAEEIVDIAADEKLKC